MKHTLSILVENRPGELARIIGLFSARGFNIESVTVAETLDSGRSRITLTTRGKDEAIQHITKLLNREVRVFSAVDMGSVKHIERETALITVNAGEGPSRQEVLSLVGIFRARVVDVSRNAIIVEASGNWEKVSRLIDLLKPFGLRDVVRTGVVAVPRLGSQSDYDVEDQEAIAVGE